MNETTAGATRNPRTRRRWVAVPLAVSAVVLVSACGSGGGTNGSGSSPSSSASSSSAPSGAALSVRSTSIGDVLADAKGATIYTFANDTGTTSTCTGECAADWPPVPAPDPLPTSLAGVTATLGTTTRDDGSTQLTVDGHPVYRFEGDSAPGQTNGQGLTLNGGLWIAVAPDGTSVPVHS